MDPAIVDLIFGVGLPLALLVVAYLVGSFLEARHYRSIRRREERWLRLGAVTLGNPPQDWEVEGSALVTGSVVVSIDYFKRFLAGLRGLVGGRIGAYETVLDRGRREAVLRLKRDAMDRGYHAVINLRLETSRLASATRNGQGTAGLEILAFGTGLRLRRPPA